MRVTRLFLLILLIFAATDAATAVELGAKGTSDSIVYGTLDGDPEFDQRAAAELSLVLEPDETAELTIRGSYEYLMSGEPYYFSLDELRYALRSDFGNSGFFTFELGRFPESDGTGLIFNEIIDGFSLAFGLPGVSASATAGYTGLVFQESSSVFVSIADAIDLQDDDLFGPPRLYVAAEGLHQLSESGLTLGFGLAAQFDLHDRDELAQPGDSVFSGAFSGAVQTQYQTVRLFGPVEERLRFDLFSSFVTGSMVVPSFDTLAFEKTPILGFLSGANLTAAFPIASRPEISASALFASGDDDSEQIIEGNRAGYSTSFVPISTALRNPWSSDSGGKLLTNTLVYSNLLLAELSASVRPFGSLAGYVAKNTSVKAGGAAVLRPSEGAAPLDGVAPSYNGIYLGSEVNLRLVIGIAPFLEVEFDGGLFFPSAEAFPLSDIWYVAVGSLRAEY